MPTNHELEQKLAATYPHSLARLQQLIIDSEACAASYAKGGEALNSAIDKFMATVGACVQGLVDDRQAADPENLNPAMEALNLAMWRCHLTYGSNWPTAFQFWRDWYAQFRRKLDA